MKIIYLTIITLLFMAVILLLIISNDFIMVKKSDALVRVNVLPAIYIESGKNNTAGKDNTRTKKKMRCHISKFMLELYENNKTGLNNSSADVVRSVVPKQAEIFSGHARKGNSAGNHLLVFDLPETSNDEIFTYAELRILTLINKKRESSTGIRRRISLFVYNELLKEFLNVHQLHVHHSNNTWISFNLTDQVACVLNNTNMHAKSFKVLVTLSTVVSIKSEDQNELRLSILPPNKDDLDHDYPILILSYISNLSHHVDQQIKAKREIKRERKKRFIYEDYEEESNSIWDDLVSRKNYEKKLKRLRNICKRKPLYVDFADINYDEWIVQPKGYEAFQCQGKCFYPVAEHLSPTKHAIIQALLHSVAPSRTPRPCCVPTSLDSISILYIDNNGVLTYRYAYKDMVVLECGCR